MEKENTIQPQLHNEAEKESDSRIHLSLERTELTWENTQLSWIRTTLGFIASGVALDKGLASMRKARIESGDAFFENTHIIGIILSIAGTLLMLISTWLYMRRCHHLARMKGLKPLWFPPAAIASILIIILGIGISFLLLVS